MKSAIIFNKIFWSVVFLLSFSACEDIVDYNDNYDDGLKSTGAPVIVKITNIADSSLVISVAEMDQMISIYGTNLSNVTAIFFNDVQTELSKVYAVNSRIVVPVPRSIPTNIDNTLTIITELGTTGTNFEVEVPDLVLSGLYNEFATAGDSVQIQGNNFDLYQVDEENGKVMLNGTELSIHNATATSFYVKIPEGTADNSVFEISSPVISVAKEISFRNWGTTILNYYDGVWGDTQAYMTDGSASGDPIPLYGIDTFQRIAKTFDAWSWNTPYGGGFDLSDEDVVANPQNYDVKLEMLTKSDKPLSIGNLNIGNYSWNPGEGGISFNTYGEWKTVKFELTDVLDGLQIGWNGFSIVFQPTDGITADFSICNVRIVRK